MGIPIVIYNSENLFSSADFNSMLRNYGFLVSKEVLVFGGRFSQEFKRQVISPGRRLLIVGIFPGNPHWVYMDNMVNKFKEKNPELKVISYAYYNFPREPYDVSIDEFGHFHQGTMYDCIAEKMREFLQELHTQRRKKIRR